MRTVWFLAGGVAGVYATSKVRQLTEALSYDGVHDRLTGWFAGARVVRDELRAGIAEKETELLERLAVGAEGASVLALPTTRPADDTASPIASHTASHTASHSASHTAGHTDNPPDESRDEH